MAWFQAPITGLVWAPLDTKQGDISYNMMRMWQGAVGVAPVDGLVSPAYVVAKPLPETNSRYYEYLFRTGAYKNEVNKFSRGIVSDRNRLYWEDFKQMPSPFPPLEEQAAIVRFLDHVDRRVRRYIRIKRQLIALLNEQKQAIIHRAVTRGLDPNVKLKPSGIEWLGDVPQHWHSRRLLHACSMVVDGTHFSPANGPDGDFLYVTAKNIKENGVATHNATFVSSSDHRTIYARCPVRKGDVLYIKDGATAGIATVNNIEEEFSMLSSVALLRPHPAVLTSQFLAMQLNDAAFKTHVLRVVVGGAMTRFTVELIKRFDLIIPPLDEQVAIHRYICSELVPIQNATARTKHEIDLVQEYRTRMIADVVTGKHDVRGAASVLPDEVEAFEQVLDEGEATDDHELDLHPEEVDA